ncbi:MAG: MATE family efflux transporter [Pacificimonas sp.]
MVPLADGGMMSPMANPMAQTDRIDPRLIWAIAIPAMLTNVATALIGLGDMWIVGRLEDAALQGAVEIGARLFALLFTVMNFLKTGTTGLVAQDGSRAGVEAQAETLARGIAIGLVIAGTLLLLKPLLLPALLSALGADGDVAAAARVYADIRYWSAPGVMVNLALIGFLIGRRQVRTALIIEVIYNLTNVGLGLLFVLQFDLGIAGIGWSSVVAEYGKLAGAGLVVLAGVGGPGLRRSFVDRASFRWAQLRPFLAVNRDIFLRTVVLMLALAVLTRLGAERGPVVLAANGIIYQLFIFSALLIDGFENAAQVINGERYGARDRRGFLVATRMILWRGLLVGAALSGVYALVGGPVIDSFAATQAVAAQARSDLWWLVAMPLAGAASYVFDGVFVGASWTRAMLVSMAGATIVYGLSLWLTWPYGNDGLWFSFVLFLAVRAVLQLMLIPGLARRTMPDEISKTDSETVR